PATKHLQEPTARTASMFVSLNAFLRPRRIRLAPFPVPEDFPYRRFSRETGITGVIRRVCKSIQRKRFPSASFLL
ncbi:hypothetical protein, partial [Leptonema illini]|uniref:hypothetical protein n=1 Tax=Leptonema illini TaxID=183 RepID=UPI001C4E24BD